MNATFKGQTQAEVQRGTVGPMPGARLDEEMVAEIAGEEGQWEGRDAGICGRVEWVVEMAARSTNALAIAGMLHMVLSLCVHGELERLVELARSSPNFNRASRRVNGNAPDSKDGYCGDLSDRPADYKIEGQARGREEKTGIP